MIIFNNDDSNDNNNKNNNDNDSHIYEVYLPYWVLDIKLTIDECIWLFVYATLAYGCFYKIVFFFPKILLFT